MEVRRLNRILIIRSIVSIVLCTYVEGAENRGSFTGAAQPDDDVKLLMVNFAGAT